MNLKSGSPMRNESATDSAYAKVWPSSRLPPLVWAMLVGFFAVFYTVYFSPATLRNGLLAPGDGEIYYLPFFGLPAWEFWSDYLLSGYPVVSDIQALTFYPLRWLSPTFNTLVVSAYVIAAVGAFGLTLNLTRSRIGAMTAAMVISGSGFMLGHLGHLSIIHSAAWTPWILWAISSLRLGRTWTPVGFGALAVALAIYGGHPQVAVIGMLLAGSYGVSEALLEYRHEGKRSGMRVLVRVFLVFFLGILIASPALVGLISSAGSGVRSAWTITDFGSFSHNFSTLRMLAFPSLFGAQPPGPYGPYLGPYNLTELALYAGIAPGMLAMVALMDCKRNQRPLFWAAAGIVSLVLGLGTTTFVGDLVFQVPVLGQFRAQARFGWIFIVCVGVLSAYGLSAILRNSLSKPQKSACIAVSALLVLGSIASVAIAPTQALLSAGAHWYTHPAFLVPVIMMAASLLAVGVLVCRPGHGVAFALIALIAVDLASFGWFHDWKYVGPHVEPNKGTLSQLKQTGVTSGKGRVLTLGADQWPAGPLRPNSNISYRVPLAVGYGPLLSARYASVAGADTVGGIARILPDAPLMDVLAIRWVAGSYADSVPLLLGSGCGAQSQVTRVRAEIPAGINVKSIRIVSHLSCSQTLPSGQSVADVILQEAGGGDAETFPMEVGVHTAEWAYDRADVKASIAHARAHVADTFDAGGFRGLWFEGTWQVPSGAAGSAIVLSARSEAGAPVRLKSVEVMDAASGNWTSLPFGPDLAAGGRLLSPPAEIASLAPLRQRAGYRGMAWMVCDSRVVALSEMASLLQTPSTDTSGGFDALETVLLEKPLPGPGASCASPMTTSVLSREPGYWKLKTVSASPGVLVVSTSFNKGWNATVNGESVRVVPAYGIVVGIPVPAGNSEIELSFFPRRLLLAIVIACLTLAAALSLGLASNIAACVARLKLSAKGIPR